MEKLIEMLTSRGHNSYDGEEVTQLEHALQATHQAVNRKLSNHLIIAALFHDIGHLIHKGEKFWDNRHQYAGSKFLEGYFPQSIWMPVFYHVTAKRYLCRDDKYFNQLSSESKRSLIIQGGIMTDMEALEFEGNVYFSDSVALRECDDNAKSVGLITIPLEEYIPLINECILPDGK